MGHGASHHAFAAYACLDHMMAVQGFPARVGAVESYPEVDIVINELSRQGVTGAASDAADAGGRRSCH